MFHDNPFQAGTKEKGIVNFSKFRYSWSLVLRFVVNSVRMLNTFLGISSLRMIIDPAAAAKRTTSGWSSTWRRMSKGHPWEWSGALPCWGCCVFRRNQFLDAKQRGRWWCLGVISPFQVVVHPSPVWRRPSLPHLRHPPHLHCHLFRAKKEKLCWGGGRTGGCCTRWAWKCNQGVEEVDKNVCCFQGGIEGREICKDVCNDAADFGIFFGIREKREEGGHFLFQCFNRLHWMTFALFRKTLCGFSSTKFFLFCMDQSEKCCWNEVHEIRRNMLPNSNRGRRSGAWKFSQPNQGVCAWTLLGGLESIEREKGPP